MASESRHDSRQATKYAKRLVNVAHNYAAFLHQAYEPDRRVPYPGTAATLRLYLLLNARLKTFGDEDHRIFGDDPETLRATLADVARRLRDAPEAVTKFSITALRAFPSPADDKPFTREHPAFAAVLEEAVDPTLQAQWAIDCAGLEQIEGQPRDIRTVAQALSTGFAILKKPHPDQQLHSRAIKQAQAVTLAVTLAVRGVWDGNSERVAENRDRKRTRLSTVPAASHGAEVDPVVVRIVDADVETGDVDCGAESVDHKADYQSVVCEDSGLVYIKDSFGEASVRPERNVIAAAKWDPKLRPAPAPGRLGSQKRVDACHDNSCQTFLNAYELVGPPVTLRELVDYTQRPFMLSRDEDHRQSMSAHDVAGDRVLAATGCDMPFSYHGAFGDNLRVRQAEVIVSAAVWEQSQAVWAGAHNINIDYSDDIDDELARQERVLLTARTGSPGIDDQLGWLSLAGKDVVVWAPRCATSKATACCCCYQSELIALQVFNLQPWPSVGLFNLFMHSYAEHWQAASGTGAARVLFAHVYRVNINETEAISAHLSKPRLLAPAGIDSADELESEPRQRFVNIKEAELPSIVEKQEDFHIVVPVRHDYHDYVVQLQCSCVRKRSSTEARVSAVIWDSEVEDGVEAKERETAIAEHLAAIVLGGWGGEVTHFNMQWSPRARAESPGPLSFFYVTYHIRVIGEMLRRGTARVSNDPETDASVRQTPRRAAKARVAAESGKEVARVSSSAQSDATGSASKAPRDTRAFVAVLVFGRCRVSGLFKTRKLAEALSSLQRAGASALARSQRAWSSHYVRLEGSSCRFALNRQFSKTCVYNLLAGQPSIMWLTRLRFPPLLTNWMSGDGRVCLERTCEVAWIDLIELLPCQVEGWLEPSLVNLMLHQFLVLVQHQRGFSGSKLSVAVSHVLDVSFVEGKEPSVRLASRGAFCTDVTVTNLFISNEIEAVSKVAFVWCSNHRFALLFVNLERKSLELWADGSLPDFSKDTATRFSRVVIPMFFRSARHFGWLSAAVAETEGSVASWEMRPFALVVEDETGVDHVPTSVVGMVRDFVCTGTVQPRGGTGTGDCEFALLALATQYASYL